MAERAETTEEVQVIVKEFPDVQSGLLAEVYPENDEEAASGPLRSASRIYSDDDSLHKRDDESFIEEVSEWVTVGSGNLVLRVERESDGYHITLHEDNTLRFETAFPDDELGVETHPALVE